MQKYLRRGKALRGENEPVGYYIRPPVLECPCTAEVDQCEDAFPRREGALNENIACLNIQMQKSC